MTFLLRNSTVAHYDRVEPNLSITGQSTGFQLELNLDKISIQLKFLNLKILKLKFFKYIYICNIVMSRSIKQLNN